MLSRLKSLLIIHGPEGPTHAAGQAVLRAESAIADVTNSGPFGSCDPSIPLSDDYTPLLPNKPCRLSIQRCPTSIGIMLTVEHAVKIAPPLTNYANTLLRLSLCASEGGPASLASSSRGHRSQLGPTNRPWYPCPGQLLGRLI